MNGGSATRTSKKTSELQALDGILRTHQAIIEKGSTQKLTTEEMSKVLVTALFEVTKQTGQKLVQVRDYNEMTGAGPFRYAGRIDTMRQEGLIPVDVHDGLEKLGRENHVGPSYLKVKSLLTWLPLREFFGHQMAFAVQEKLEAVPKDGGFVVIVPNMTGGAWIGDETIRQLDKLYKNGSTPAKLTVWPVTAYARDMRIRLRKIISDETKPKYGDHIEGLMPSPANTAALVVFEELRTAAETTKNATDIHRNLGGYSIENGVKIVEAAVFDYRHPVGVERLNRLGVDSVFLVDGKTFFEVSKELNYITELQAKAGIDWLTDPWDFTRKIMPHLQSLVPKVGK